MCIRESAASANRRPVVGPVPCARLIIPRGRDPFRVVGSIEVEFVGFSRAEGVLSVRLSGKRRSQQRKILMIDELTGSTRWTDKAHPSFDPLLMRV